MGPLPGTKREANPESQLGETCEETLPNGAKEVVTKTRAGRWGSRRLNRAEDCGRLRPAPDLGAKNPQRLGCHRSQLKGSSPGPCGVGWTPGGTNWKPQTRSPCWNSFTPQTVTGETGPSDQARRVRRPVDSEAQWLTEWLTRTPAEIRDRGRVASARRSASVLLPHTQPSRSTGVAKCVLASMRRLRANRRRRCRSPPGECRSWRRLLVCARGADGYVMLATKNITDRR